MKSILPIQTDIPQKKKRILPGSINFTKKIKKQNMQQQHVIKITKKSQKLSVTNKTIPFKNAYLYITW